MNIFEIDPSKKYAIVFDRKLRPDEADRLRANFKDFMENPDSRFLIIEGAKLVKVDEVHIPAIDEG